MQKPSRSGALNRADLYSIFKGALIVGGATSITYFLQGISNSDFGVYSPLVVAASSVVINFVRKYMNGV